MNGKKDIIGSISKDTGLPRDLVAEVIDSMIRTAQQEVIDNSEFRLPGLLTIKSRRLPARETVSMKTGERLALPPVETLYAKVSPTLIKEYKSSKQD